MYFLRNLWARLDSPRLEVHEWVAVPKLNQDEVKTREVLEWSGLHLFHFNGSSCSQKTRIFLNLKKLDWASHHVDLVSGENFTEWYLGINPRGLVPTLVDDGEVHIESNDIIEYLEERFPTPPLMPADLRDEILQSLKEEDDLHFDLRNLTHKYLAPFFMTKRIPKFRNLELFRSSDAVVRGEADQAKLAEVKWFEGFLTKGITNEVALGSALKFKRAFDALDMKLESQGYFHGSALTITDVAWFIYADRLSSLGYPLGELHPRVSRWYQGLLAKEEFSRELLMPKPLLAIHSMFRGYHNLTGTGLKHLFAKA
ncbi:MAG: glutathione S-transferase family protein [Deltaproteobacteria bacterium]